MLCTVWCNTARIIPVSAEQPTHPMLQCCLLFCAWVSPGILVLVASSCVLLVHCTKHGNCVYGSMWCVMQYCLICVSWSFYRRKHIGTFCGVMEHRYLWNNRVHFVNFLVNWYQGGFESMILKWVWEFKCTVCPNMENDKKHQVCANSYEY